MAQNLKPKQNDSVQKKTSSNQSVDNNKKKLSDLAVNKRNNFLFNSTNNIENYNKNIVLKLYIIT